MQEDEIEPAEVQEVVDVVTTAKLITKVVTDTSETVTATSAIITTAEAQVPDVTLTAAPARVAAAPSRRRKGVVIRDPEEESTTSTIIPVETKSKDKGKRILVEEPKPLKKKKQIEQDEQYARELHAELNKDIDWDKAIDHVKKKAKEDPAVKRYQVLKRKLQTKAQARKNMMMYLKNVVGFKMDYFNGISYDDIRPIFEAKFNSNVDFLLKIKEQIEEDENRALQKLNETLAEKAAKRRKLDEERGLGGFMKYTCSDLEESKNYTWSSKGQRIEATRIMWCADHNFYIYSADFVSGEEVPAHKIHSRPDAECCQVNAAKVKLMLLKQVNAVKQQRIRLYCKGNDHGEYILQSIDEGPFKMGWCKDKIASGTDAPYLGPERDTMDSDLSQPEKDRLRANIRNKGAQKRVGNANDGQGKPIKCYNYNGIGHIARNFDQCDAFDSDVDEAPTAQTMFIANLSSATPFYDQAGLSYDSDTLSETMFIANLSSATPFYDQAGLSYDSDTFSEDNKAPVVQSDASSVPNDTVMMVTNDVYEQDAPCVTFNQPNNTDNASLTTKLARYKELAKVYEKRAQFELTRRELMIDTQMRMIIKDRNFKEESLQKELHSIKIQLNSTINHNKLIREEVSTLKQDFKQKESKLLEEFLEMKLLKEKVEDKLYKQDQSLQTVHTLCKPKSFYDEINKEIVKPNRARLLVHDSEDTLEIAETTRKQMITKMNDPEYVKNKGKDHGEYILQSIDEGPFKMGWCKDKIASGTDAPYLGPERDTMDSDLLQPEKDRLKANIRAQEEEMGWVGFWREKQLNTIEIFLRKLKTRWSGPFTINQVFPYGTVELSQPDGPNFTVNGHHVKHYFGGDIPSKCMRTRSNFYPFNSSTTILRRSNRRHIQSIVEPEFRAIENIVLIADRTIEELLQAPTKGYGEAIVIPEILAKNFEIKTNLLQLVQANKFYGFERDNPHTHIGNFKRITATLKYRDVPNDAIKLMLFPYSLEGAARVWYEKEPPNSILTWDDLVNKFVNQFFPPSKTTHLINKISQFIQRFEETFEEAWDHFKEMLRACPHHGFSELTQIDTIYNGLTEQDQDSLNAAAGGNLLNKTTREALNIIENKLKVRYSRSKSNVSRVNMNFRDVVSEIDDRIDKLVDQISNLVKIVNKQVIAPAKAVEKTCVTCGGAHAYYECIATDSNPSSVCVATGSYNQVSSPNRASHQIPPPGFAPVQNNPNRFNQGFQNQPFLVPNNQIPPSVLNEFSNYMKSIEIMIKSMQNQINVLRGDFNKQEENLRRNLNNDMRSILGSFFQNQPSTSGTLPSNIVPNPKGEMKAVTTRSGLAYEGLSIPTESLLEKVDEQNTEEILDKEYSNSSGSTAQIQPPVVPISIPKPDVPRTQTKPTIPYPSSFADSLLLMPKFASTIKSLLANKDKLFELEKVLLNENCLAMLLKKLSEKLGDPELTSTRMTLELADRSITHPKGVVEDVFVKVRKFHFPTDFVVVDFEADPRVPLILGRSFLRTARSLIDVYGEEITLRVNDESITFNLNQTIRYSLTYDDTSVNRVDVIDIACEEFMQDVLDFQYNPKSSSPTLVSDDLISKSNSRKVPIVKSSSPTLTPFGESDFFLKEIEDFLNDDSIPTGIENSEYDPEGDILFLKKNAK
nr:hypothetical protein [Tanacetum cinerariifolium]